MYNDTSTPTVKNCIFWNSFGGEIFNNASSPAISFCVVANEDVGIGSGSSDIISADPLLDSIAWNGADKTFMITPDAGYDILEVVVDGIPFSVDASTYTVHDVSADNTIAVSFDLAPTSIPPASPTQFRHPPQLQRCRRHRGTQAGAPFRAEAHFSYSPFSFCRRFSCNEGSTKEKRNYTYSFQRFS